MITQINIFDKNQNFKSGDLNDNFIKSLKQGDLFSFHCRDFIKYLGFKRCDKNFRKNFLEFLNLHKIKYVISNKRLTKDIIYNFVNAEKIVKENLDKPIFYGRETWRSLYNRLINEKSTTKTFEELVEDQIKINKRIYSLEIKEDKQCLSGGFNSGCWLILLKL